MTRRFVSAFAVLATAAAPTLAGVTNPNISVIGQPFIQWNDDPTSPGYHRATLDPGEVEAVFDAYLNPYAFGSFTLALGEEGMELEEGYFQLLRGLPLGLALKGGQYRVGFGKLNPIHPHAYPFAERWRVMANYLPGEESYDETGMSLSERIPMPGDFSLVATGDWLQGDTFRIEREPSGASNDPIYTDEDLSEDTRPAFVGRVDGFTQIGEQSGLEVGLSATQGTNNVAADTKTTILGADVKAKLWDSPNSYLVLQGELLRQQMDSAEWDSTSASYTTSEVTSNGGYAYVDYNFKVRYNLGGGYERYRQPIPDGPWDYAFKAWAGFSLMEETTVFRLDWDYYQPGTPPGGSETPAAVNTVTLRVIFSMGPHKAHQF